jgi:HK97 gp10 family phage protein
MSDGVMVKLDGLDTLAQELRKLSQATQERIMKGAMAKAASVIRREAVARAPMWTGEVSQGHPPPGTLKKAIYQARMVMKCTNDLEVWTVNVRSGKGARHSGSTSSKAGPTRGTNLDAYYARWVEYGHYTRGPALTASQRKKHMQGVAAGTVYQAKAHFVLPRPFMRPAFEMKKAEALQVFQTEFMARTRIELQSYRILGIK